MTKEDVIEKTELKDDSVMGKILLNTKNPPITGDIVEGVVYL
jgi:hypothetical protein